jgi:hypothetical protein
MTTDANGEKQNPLHMNLALLLPLVKEFFNSGSVPNRKISATAVTDSQQPRHTIINNG